MASLKLSPVLADAADLLGGQLRAHIRQLAAAVKPHAGCLERKFVSGMKAQGFYPWQCKALAAITVGAAARISTTGHPLAEFFEQVEYNGRRLAKLDLRRGAVLEALGRYDHLLSEVLKRPRPLSTRTCAGPATSSVSASP